MLILFSLLAACSKTKAASTSANQTQTITVTEQTHTGKLYFDGFISPIKTKAVISPIEGSVDAMFFNYGEQVKKGQLLVKLKSTSLEKSYQQAVSSYLTAKEKYNTSKNDIVGAQDLFKAGITSAQTYASAQSTLNDSYLSYLQAKQALINLFQSTGINQKDIYLLQIDDEAAVKKALEMPLKEINIFASMDGIALKPIKSSSSGGGEAIHEGSFLKADQDIAEIGKMSGLKIDIKVDEISINKIKIGDTAVVTGSGFPGITLSGIITAISSQANASEGGGSLPTFPVVVAVDHLTTDQQQLIHVGMSAKVQIDTGTQREIIVPINAVKMQDGKTYVQFVNPVNGKIVLKEVKTGKTTMNGVTIISGLKPGDKIVAGD